MSLIKLMSSDTTCNGNSIKQKFHHDKKKYKNCANNINTNSIIYKQDSLPSHMQFVKIKIKIIEQPRELIIEKTGFKQKKSINKKKHVR